MTYSAARYAADKSAVTKSDAANEAELAVGALTMAKVTTQIAFRVAGIGSKSPAGVAITALMVMAYFKAVTDFIEQRERERVATERAMDSIRDHIRDRAEAFARGESGNSFDRAFDHSVNEGRADGIC